MGWVLGPWYPCSGHCFPHRVALLTQKRLPGEPLFPVCQPHPSSCLPLSVTPAPPLHPVGSFTPRLESRSLPETPWLSWKRSPQLLTQSGRLEGQTRQEASRVRTQCPEVDVSFHPAPSAGRAPPPRSLSAQCIGAKASRTHPKAAAQHPFRPLLAPLNTSRSRCFRGPEDRLPPMSGHLQEGVCPLEGRWPGCILTLRVCFPHTWTSVSPPAK